MKKIKLFFLILIFITSASFAKKPSFARAKSMTWGKKGESGISWSDPSEVNILLKIEDNSLTIFSATTQKYHMIRQISDNGSITKYFATNLDGTNCYVLLGSTQEGIYIGVEFSDIVFYYICIPEE